MSTSNGYSSLLSMNSVNPRRRATPVKPKQTLVDLTTRLAQTAILLLPLVVCAAAADSPGSPEGGGVNFMKAPEGARSVTVPLAVQEGAGTRSQGYLAQRSPQPVDELTALPPSIAETFKGKQASAFEVAVLPDGTRYVVVLAEDKSVRFLNRNETMMWYARLYRLSPGSDVKPEILREGFQSAGGDVTVPVELPLPGIGQTKVKTFRTEVGYSLSGFNNDKPQVYKGRGSALQVSGSDVTPEGKLTLTVTVPEEMRVTPETQVSLRFEPLKPGLPERTASGKLTDFLTIGTARFVVTALAPDFSSATLAVVSGSLEATLKQQLQLGAQMPPFSQMELLTRKTVTREELLAKAKNAAAVIFVFADFMPTGNRFGGPYGPPMGVAGNTALPLPAAEAFEQAGLELEPKPLVVFVTRQIGIDFLYGDLRNKTPEYMVLTDYADPLRTTFRVPQSGPGGWYGGPSYPGGNEPSLRQLFNLPERTISIAAFDRTGKVVYVKADAGSQFLASLAEARAAVKSPGGSGQ